MINIYNKYIEKPAQLSTVKTNLVLAPPKNHAALALSTVTLKHDFLLRKVFSRNIILLRFIVKEHYINRVLFCWPRKSKSVCRHIYIDNRRSSSDYVLFYYGLT